MDRVQHKPATHGKKREEKKGANEMKQQERKDPASLPEKLEVIHQIETCNEVQNPNHIFHLFTTPDLMPLFPCIYICQ